MRRIALFLLGFILFIAALNIIALPIPYRAAWPFDSPVATLRLTPPFRATPTGWPNAPFAWQVREREREPVTRGWLVPMAVK